MTTDHHKRVLVVDDDPDIRGLLVTALRLKSLAVDSATNGAEALDLIRRNSYGVVLLDLFMPEINGFAVLDGIEHQAQQPVVLVITGADRATIEKLDPRRIHGIIRKPFDIDDLTSVVVSCADIRSPWNLDALALAVISGPLVTLMSS